MPPRFRMTISQFTIKTALRFTFKTSRLLTLLVTTLLWTNAPKVEANQPQSTQDPPVCQEEVLLQKPPLQQNGESCQTSEPSEAEDLDESSTKTNADAPTNDTETNLDDANQDGAVDDATDSPPPTSDGDSSNLDTTNGGNSDIPDNLTEQSNPSSSQDSHDINFSLDLNLGGGSTAPPDSSTETMPPENDQIDPSSINPSQNAPIGSEGADSQQLVSPNPKPKAKKPHRNKAEKHQKKTNKQTRIKEQHPKQSHKKDHIKGKNHVDKLKGVKPRKRNLRNHPGQIHSKPHRSKASGSLRRRSRFHPSGNHLRKHVRPTKVFRKPSHRHVR